MSWWRHFSWLVLITACSRSEPARRDLPGARPASSAHDELWSLRDAEQRRDSTAIEPSALSSRELGVRRSAARALARIADARAAELLYPALADEDSEVSTWAAYGLGYACRGREPKTVRALVARAASLPDAAPGTPLWSPSEAISDALGRCATAEAESTLRAWLHGPSARAEAAALALGRLASRTGKLDAVTLVELLDAESHGELHAALYPLARLPTLNASSAERTRALALQRIEAHAADSEFALRALARTGPAGATALGRLLASRELSDGLRAEAARELAQLGTDGQGPLWAAFDRVAERPPSDAELAGTSYAWLSALLDALNPPLIGSARALRALSELPLGASDAPHLRRRKAHLRCTAAALLAGSNYQSPSLLACDTSEASRARELATLRVIGQDKLRGRRKQAYLQRAHASDALLQEAALGLLAEHGEVPEAYELLSQALTRKSLGVVASAAQVLARFPERATRGASTTGDGAPQLRPEPSVIQALAAAYAEATARNSVEVRSVLLDAIGALQALSLKDLANRACRSDNPSLREHAESALHLLGEQSLRCDRFEPEKRNLEPLRVAPPSIITLETDAGNLSLRLDPSFAPSAVTRVVDLVRAGFYDGLEIHRVVPGFVAQFGDPGADGYGGDDRPALRCETSPLPFTVGSVGVALSGRDSGSSQLFVTLGRYPHLDGEYAWLGEAGPGWDRVAAGDRILHARVSGSP